MLKTKYADPIKTMYYQIRKRIVVFLIMGIVFSFGIGLGLLGTILSNEELQIHIILFISFSFIFSITILCYSLAIMINPHLYRPVRTNPDIYKQLYLLAENTEYQDRLICLSGNIISPINMLYNILNPWNLKLQQARNADYKPESKAENHFHYAPKRCIKTGKNTQFML